MQTPPRPQSTPPGTLEHTQPLRLDQGREDCWATPPPLPGQGIPVDEGHLFRVSSKP